MPFSLGFWAAAGGGGAASNPAMELISTTILGSNQSSVTFSSITGTYKHLQIRMVTRNSNAGATYDNSSTMTFNGDTTTSNYYWHALEGNGSGVNTPYSNSYVGMIRNTSTGLNVTNAFAPYIIDILDYANSNKNKTIKSLNGQNNSTYSSFGVGLNSGVWFSNSAITSITIGASSGNNWVTGSRFSLYGIKG